MVTVDPPADPPAEVTPTPPAMHNRVVDILHDTSEEKTLISKVISATSVIIEETADHAPPMKAFFARFRMAGLSGLQSTFFSTYFDVGPPPKRIVTQRPDGPPTDVQACWGMGK